MRTLLLAAAILFAAVPSISAQSFAEIEADGALQAKLDAFVKTQANWATALSTYPGAIVPQFSMGGAAGAAGGGTGLTNFMDILSMQAAKQLALDMTIKSGPVQPQSPVRTAPGR